METGGRNSIDISPEGEEEERPDPFSQIIAVHPALGEVFGVPPDIYEALFDGFFESEAFSRWVSHRNVWQLSCLGGPGTGKV